MSMDKISSNTLCIGITGIGSIYSGRIRDMGIQGHETSDPSVSYIKPAVALRGGRNLCV